MIGLFAISFSQSKKLYLTQSQMWFCSEETVDHLGTMLPFLPSSKEALSQIHAFVSKVGKAGQLIVVFLMVSSFIFHLAQITSP